MVDAQHLRHPQHSPAEELALSKASIAVIAAVGAVIVCFALSLLNGWPQRATALIVGEQTAIRAAAAGESSGYGDYASGPGFDSSSFGDGHSVRTDAWPRSRLCRMLHGARHWWESNLAPLLRRRWIGTIDAGCITPWPTIFRSSGIFRLITLLALPEGESIHLGTVGDLSWPMRCSMNTCRSSCC